MYETNPKRQRPHLHICAFLFGYAVCFRYLYDEYKPFVFRWILLPEAEAATDN